MATSNRNRSRSGRSSGRGNGRAGRDRAPEAPIITAEASATGHGNLFGLWIDQDEIAANDRRAWTILIGYALVSALVLFAVIVAIAGVALSTVIVAAIVALVIGGSLTALFSRTFAGILIRKVNATPLASDAAPRLDNLLDGLCASFGVPRPSVLGFDDPVINAMAIGNIGQPPIVIVTTGLLENLDRLELEGVLAHELAHIKRHDHIVGTLAAMWCDKPFRAVFGDDLLLKLAGRGRELRADQVGATLVHSPDGMARAMDRCLKADPPAPGSRFAGPAYAMTRWLWFDPSIGRRSADETVDVNDATAVRLGVLSEW
jgi:Zn-dependent protease with chaperone function